MTKKPKFLRTGSNLAKRLGKGRKKKQRWRSPKGRDNKMREKKKGHPATVNIGYRSDVKIRGKIKEKTPVVVKNIQDLEKIGKGQIGILGKIGQKKKIEIAKKAEEKKIEIANLNIKKILRKTQKKENKK